MTGETLYLVTRTATWGGSLVSTESVLLIVTMKALIQESSQIRSRLKTANTFFQVIMITATGWPICLTASSWLLEADNMEQLTQAAGWLWPPLAN